MNEGEQKYRQAGLGRRVGFGDRPAILVVDFNKGCTDPASPLPPLMNLEREIAATRSLIDLARPSGALVLYTTLGPYREDLQDIGPLGHKVPGLRIFTAGSKWAEIDDRLDVRPDDYVIWKKWQSSFFGTDLLSILVHRRIDTLIVTGCVTSGCVRATVVDACTHGFRVVIPRDCVGDRTVEIHEANLFDMNAKNADVMPLAEVEAWFRSRLGQADAASRRGAAPGTAAA
jgi:maleamate amidohydrolase